MDPMHAQPPAPTRAATTDAAARGASVKAAILADPEEGARRLVAEEGPALFALAVRLAPDAGEAEELVFRAVGERLAPFLNGHGRKLER